VAQLSAVHHHHALADKIRIQFLILPIILALVDKLLRISRISFVMGIFTKHEMSCRALENPGFFCGLTAALSELADQNPERCPELMPERSHLVKREAVRPHHSGAIVVNAHRISRVVGTVRMGHRILSLDYHK
jgi:hypothetical protein